ncbi:MAG: SRPBCC domain-containing protein [Pseudanabaena sp. RU_4_16]|nr:SRPBCC domain-containing protein [Pseudanabaena sp. RU_4_16]
MKQDITLEVFYPHSLDRVWQALTDRRALTAWMMDNDFEPRLGHKFQFRYSVLTGFDTFIHCEVIAIEPPQLLAYRWRDPQTQKSSIVCWKLIAVSGGTKLQLQHDREFHIAAISPPVIPSSISSDLPQRSDNQYDSFPHQREYESPMNTLMLRSLNDLQTQQLDASSTTLTTEAYSRQLQSEWNYYLAKLTQELNSHYASHFFTELLETES